MPTPSKQFAESPLKPGRRAAARRGVILLVIMGLLAMFCLVAIAFVLNAGQFRRSSRFLSRVELRSEPANRLCDQAFRQAVRGSNSSNSVLCLHSLLEDSYGNEWIAGTIGGLQPVAGGQLMEFDAPASPPARFGGRVLTMTSGAAAGLSTNIVGIGSTGKLQAMAFRDAVPAMGDTYIINGTAFSGTGFGFMPTATVSQTPLSAKNSFGWEIALLPNTPMSLYGASGNPPGGANEDYDAPDYQNMLLGAVINNTDGSLAQIIPSLHRPDLIQYWMTRMGGVAKYTDLPPDLQRLILLRPNPVDHPNFSKLVNPTFNPASLTGPFDVDNDGDGTPDSIWVDLGMPVRFAADGRLYKPLFAILCVDMDGKLNLNAHGTLDQTNAAYYQAVNAGSEVPGGAEVFAGGASATLPRGQGFGPAEINLGAIFNSQADYATFLGSTAGRYGMAKQAGFPGNDVPSQPGTVVNPLAVNLLFDFQGNYWNFATRDGWGSPPDILGCGAVGLDPAGRPLYASMGLPAGLAYNPYKINLALNAPRGLTVPIPAAVSEKTPNNPFSMAELERLLRVYDRDAGTLPNRLWNLTATGGISTLLPRRNMITTDSWDLPCPGLSAPKTLRDALAAKRPQHIVDLLVAAMGATNATHTAMRSLLPPEMLAGMKMDVNRPFGNGLDDNGNGVVDEDAEAAGDQVGLYTNKGTRVTPKFNHLNTDNPAEFGNVTDRQLQARYLYVLAMLLGDLKSLDLRTGGREQTCRLLAQWAVNAVDFRDRDSIMTKFAYSVNPFTAAGWNPPGDAAHIVWGCERPELLITETLAFHDRRTEDLDTDDGKKTKTTETDADKKDPNYDQRLRPQDSLFLELYNPNSELSAPSGEMQVQDTATNKYGVAVNKRVNDSGDPVWRMVICKADAGVQPRDPDDPTQTPPVVERSVYFVAPGQAYGPDGVQFYPSVDMASKIAPVLPGRYMVVGPGEKTASAGKHTTYLGEQGADIRRIELTPTNNPTTSAVTLNKTGTAAEVKNAAVAVINTPRRLSVSEPSQGYEATDKAANGAYSETSGYATPYDMPFDLDATRHTENAADMTALAKTGTTNAFRIVYLQRLADPTQPWSATENPYRTVDSMPIDLTAFNGLASDQSEPGFGAAGTIDFTSRERGTTEAKSNAVAFNIWRQEPVLPKTPSAGALKSPAGGDKFRSPWALSLGYLNEVFGAPNASGRVPGDPTAPFPWLTWNNRPYTSPLELMLVPSLRSSKLLACPDTAVAPVVGYDIPKTPSTAINAYMSAPWQNPANRYYPHLLPFLESGPPGVVTPTTANAAADLYRMFDYLQVPSRFVGAVVQGNPQAFASGDHSFHPPFNKISTYREPGRINLNTIYNKEVFAGLVNNFPYAASIDALWDKFTRSRRGASAAALPSLIARPFRTFGGAEMVPRTDLRPTREIDATFMRADPDDPTKPLFSQAVSSLANDPDRSPYFRYQGLSRLANLVTTRSNVYAIWITVGYFEVTPWTAGVDQYHPDGFQLNGELGSDTGDMVRHRAFYIFDRSIPVGFQRGMDNNIEKGIIVRRYIE